jgi:radical SAM superfamily enzyme YgiQ (UPF0313 family)
MKKLRYAIFAVDTVSLGVGYIISYLRRDGHEVKLIMESFLYPDEKDLMRKVKEYNPDVCLFSCLTVYYQWALKISKRIKEELGCKIIFGGLHVTSCPDVVRENKWIDDICIGDGIEYFGYKFDPDEVFPSRKDFYDQLPPHYHVHPYMMTSFGCPYHCTYCLPSHLKLSRPRRSVDGCIRELHELKSMGAKRMFIWDDTFTIDIPWVMEFLGRYKKEINLPFRCVTHPAVVKDEVIKALKDAKCYLIGIGLQTGNRELRKKILNRFETNEQFIEACRIIKSHKLALTVDHIFEIPGETEATNLESLALYRKVRPDLMNTFKLIYLPKAKIIDHAIAAGILNEKDVYNIEHGIGNNYASGEHFRVATINNLVNKMLAVPLGGGLWELMPDWLIKLACYLRIGRDFLPQTVIQNQIYFNLKRLQKWLRQIR